MEPMSTRLAAVLVLLAGAAIAWFDTRPTWDDTGITAGALLAVSAAGTLGGLRPWTAAGLAVSPLLAAEWRDAGLALLLAPAFALAGSFIATAARRLLSAP
jgi:hypothetical protein